MWLHSWEWPLCILLKTQGENEFGLIDCNKQSDKSFYFLLLSAVLIILTLDEIIETT